MWIICMVCCKDPFALGQYEEHNIFLADINNDRATKNPLYAGNLATLQKFVMFRFQHDVTVVPRDSAWFGFYNGTQLLTMQETALYQVRAGFALRVVVPILVTVMCFNVI